VRATRLPREWRTGTGRTRIPGPIGVLPCSQDPTALGPTSRQGRAGMPSGGLAKAVVEAFRPGECAVNRGESLAFATVPGSAVVPAEHTRPCDTRARTVSGAAAARTRLDRRRRRTCSRCGSQGRENGRGIHARPIAGTGTRPSATRRLTLAPPPTPSQRFVRGSGRGP